MTPEKVAYDTTIATSTLALSLDDRGRIVSIRHGRGHLEFLGAVRYPVGLWRLGLMRPVVWQDPLPAVEIPDIEYAGHEIWANRNEYQAELVVDSDDVTVPEIREDAGGLALYWHFALAGGECKVHVRIVVGDDAAGIRFGSAVTAPEGWAIRWLILPRIRGFGDLSMPAADAVLYPHNFGVLRRDPLAEMVSFTGQYPGAANWCQMAAWLHGSDGVTVSVRDPATHHTGIDVQYVEGTHPAPENTERWFLDRGRAPWLERPAASLTERVAAGLDPAIQMQCRHWPAMVRRWECPYPVVLHGFSGGWYAAARIHRSWATGQRWCSRGPLHTRRNRPQALLDLDVWVARYGFPPASDRPRPAWEFRDVMCRLHDALGMPFGVHWYHWHRFSWHSSFPCHAPPVEGFAEVVAALQERGIVVMPYCQGRLLYRDRPTFDAERCHATVEANGQPYLEMYTPQDDWPLALCPSSSWSAGQWREAARSLWDDGHVDGVYFDQIAAMPPSLCYHGGHGHRPGGGNHYWNGYDRALAEVAKLRDAEPERRFLSSELLADAFLDRLDLLLPFVPPLEDYVPLFPAIYGDYTTLMGRSTPVEVMADPVLMAVCQGEQFLFGAQLGWVNESILNHPAATAYLRGLARLRSRVRHVLALAELATPPSTHCEPAATEIRLPGAWCGRPGRDLLLRRPPVRATAWWEPTSDVRLLLLVNQCPEPVHTVITLPPEWPAAVWEMWALGAAAPHPVRGARELTVELGSLGAVALMENGRWRAD